MNYPIWELPASGLLIAFVAIVHVYVSHFAVGGGLLLVVAEHKARRERDEALLGFLEKLSRFFILLTLVFGALTGVGIWFTIGLVHPQATSSLINTFVWGWAIEWTFFVIEIAAAMVYYHGWKRLPARTHLAVGWIYFGSAWASLLVINGILTFMLTPGDWVVTRGFWSGFFNPTMLPSLFMRTFVATGIAGLFTLFILAWTPDPGLKARLGRWAGLRWVIPSAIAIPVCMVWYFLAAVSAGIPAGRILGAEGEGLSAVVAAIFSSSGQSGHPSAQIGAFVTTVASLLVVLMTLAVVFLRRGAFGKAEVTVILVVGLAAMGGGEWVREDLRKPYVIGGFMFVNGVRLPAPERAPAGIEDPFTVEALDRNGVLASALWSDAPDLSAPGFGSLAPEIRAAREAEAGREVFKLLCSSCHTVDGYLAIRPLVQGASTGSLERTLDQLARPVDRDGREVAWNHPGLSLRTWRERRMPPFTGTPAEKRALAIFLSRLGGDERAGIEEAAPAAGGETVFEDWCAACHGPDGDWPLAGMEERLEGLDADGFYDILGRLSEINENMPEFEGTEEERRALARYLAGLAGEGSGDGRDENHEEDRP